MLTTGIERYLALRRSLGFKLHETSQILRSFGRFAATRGDTHVKSATAIDWATEASSPNARRVHLQDVVRLARFLHGEEPVATLTRMTAPTILKLRSSTVMLRSCRSGRDGRGPTIRFVTKPPR